MYPGAWTERGWGRCSLQWQRDAAALWLLVPAGCFAGQVLCRAVLCFVLDLCMHVGPPVAALD